MEGYIARLLHLSEVKNCKAGQIIFKEGEMGRTMIILASGRIGLSKSHDGKDQQIAVIEAGGIIGEMALLDHRPRSATAVAMEDCQLLEINERNFEYIFLRVPELSIRITRQLSYNLRLMNDEVVKLRKEIDELKNKYER